ERTVLDIDTSMGDGAQLGHASSLESGQAVPAGERWHGSPAQRTDVNYVRVAPAPCGALRRAGFCALTLLLVCLLYLPFMQGGFELLGNAATSPGGAGVVTLRGILTGALVISILLFFGLALIGLLLVCTVPRVLNRFLEPGRVYALYGFHDRVHRVI